MKEFTENCASVGQESCMVIYYEHLVMNRSLTLKKISKFLDIQWNEAMLSHEKFIGDRVKISDSEWSTSQIKQPVYTESVNAWAGKIPIKALEQLNKYAPILQEHGYNPMANNSYNKLPV